MRRNPARMHVRLASLAVPRLGAKQCSLATFKAARFPVLVITFHRSGGGAWNPKSFGAIALLHSNFQTKEHLDFTMFSTCPDFSIVQFYNTDWYLSLRQMKPEKMLSHFLTAKCSVVTSCMCFHMTAEPKHGHVMRRAAPCHVPPTNIAVLSHHFRLKSIAPNIKELAKPIFMKSVTAECQLGCKLRSMPNGAHHVFSSSHVLCWICFETKFHVRLLADTPEQ